MRAVEKNDPKVIELSYDILEKIVTSIDFTTKDEPLRLATIMNEKAQNGDYPDVIKFAYADALAKVELLGYEQLCAVKKIVNDEDESLD